MIKTVYVGRESYWGYIRVLSRILSLGGSSSPVQLSVNESLGMRLGKLYKHCLVESGGTSFKKNVGLYIAPQKLILMQSVR